MNNSEMEWLIYQHKEYWQVHRERMRQYTRAYLGTMFADMNDAYHTGQNITINTADAYAYIEGLVASIYAKAPAVSCGADIKGKGDPDMMGAIVNRFMYDRIEEFEKGLRYSFIYPYSFFKLGLKEADSVMDGIEVRPIHPWDVVVDFDADTWDRSRYVAHRYYLPYHEAKKRYKGVKFDTIVKEEYLENVDSYGSTKEGSSTAAALDGSNLLSYVEIFEFYDLMEDELIFYSPSLKRADKTLERVSPIPFRKADNSPCPPLAPLYLSYAPDTPLRGYSTLGRVYDQLWEINNLRTVWANGLRRDARIYVTKKGAIDEEGKAILAENRDQSIVELDVPPDVDARNCIVPLAVNTFSPDYQIYKAEVRADLDRGSVLAPFTRGIATNASATEVSALTQYSANEIGRVARFYHRSIELVAEIYQSLLLHLVMTAEKEVKETVLIEHEAIVITAEKLSGKFKYAFADQASTPIAGAIKRGAIMQLLPTLQGLGVPPETILDYLVETFDLPAEFLADMKNAMEMAQAQAPALGPGASAMTEPPQIQEPALPPGGGQLAAQIRGAGQMTIDEGLVKG